MNFSEHGQDRGKKVVSVAVVVMIHALVLYALFNGLGQQIIRVIQEIPVQISLIQETQEIKPPAPLTPVLPAFQPKRVSPKPFVPTPEIAVQQLAPADAIQAVTQVESSQTELVATTSQPTKAPSVVPAVVDFSTCNKPDYPRNALRNEEQGTVRIQFLVSLDGSVAEAKIDKSSGFRLLDGAAKNALRLCKFKPGTIDGVPQQSWTTVNYVWKLPN